MAREVVSLPLQTREAPIRGFKDDSRSFEVVWTTGAKVRRYDYRFDRHYDEVLSLDPEHVRMGRLGSGRAPLLDSHQTWGGVRSALGVVSSAVLAGDEGVATVRFSKRPDAAEIMEDVRDGITTSVSVGYRVHKFEMVPPARDGGVWEYRAVDWEPYELSFVTIPADAGASARAADPFDGARSAPCEFFNPAEPSANTQEKRMYRSFIAPLGVKVDEGADDAAVRSALVAHLKLKADAGDDEIVAAAVKRSAPEAPVGEQAPADEVEQSRVEARKAERGRIAEIIKLCDKHRADAELQARAVSEGWSAERTGLEILNARAAKGAEGPGITSPASEQRSGSWDHVVKKFGG